MAALSISCIRVSDTMKCPHCMGLTLVKNGFTKNLKQQYSCKSCNKSCIENYTYHAYHRKTNENIVALIKEGSGIRNIARLLSISPTTVLSRIEKIALKISPPILSLYKTYEVDEINTFVQKKANRVWVIYVLERESRKVVGFNIGTRSSETAKNLINKLVDSQAICIHTDKCNIYPSLIPSEIHKKNQYGTNHIERNNLTLRVQLKRFQRKGLSFSRSIIVLSQILIIYFFASN